MRIEQLHDEQGVAASDRKGRGRLTGIVISASLALLLMGFSPQAAQAEETDTNSPNPYSDVQTDELLVRAAAGESVAGVKLQPADDSAASQARTSGYGEYVSSLTSNLGQGNVRMSGNAVGLPNPSSNQFRLTSYLVIDGTTQDGGSVNISNSSGGSLPDLYYCYPEGTVVTYVVGLLQGSTVIDKATSGTIAG
jgi:hypothetical protein